MEHFVKPSYGKILHFCHTAQGICYGSINGEFTTGYEVLLEDGQPDFDVLIDNNDCMHLVCQNSNGDIIYFIYDGKGWTKQILMQSRSGDNSPKNFSLIRVGNWINVIYSLEYKNNTIITHQIIGNTGVTPDALDYIDGDFSVAKDKFNNIFVLYYSLTYQNFGFKAYSWSKKEWSEFIPVPVEGIITQPHIFIDKSDVIHIAGRLNDEILYYSDTIQMFGKGNNPIFIEKDNLYLLWENQEDGKVQAACSTDNGKSFSTTTEFMAGRFSSAKRYRISYTSYEKSCRASQCYGYVSDGNVKFYLTPDFFNINRVPPKPIETSIIEEAKEFEKQLLPQNQTSQTTDYKKLMIAIEKISVKLDIILNLIEKKQNNS